MRKHQQASVSKRSGENFSSIFITIFLPAPSNFSGCWWFPKWLGKTGSEPTNHELPFQWMYRNDKCSALQCTVGSSLQRERELSNDASPFVEVVCNVEKNCKHVAPNEKDLQTKHGIFSLRGIVGGGWCLEKQVWRNVAKAQQLLAPRDGFVWQTTLPLMALGCCYGCTRCCLIWPKFNQSINWKRNHSSLK